jgi:hypothetical protein
MFEVRDAVREVHRAVDVLARGLAPETVPASACLALVAEVALAERQLAGVKARLACRVAETPAWRHQGHRSAAHWLAGQSGSSVAEAVSLLQTAERLKELPATTRALVDGSLSRAQAAAVTDAAAVVPAAEAELLAVARKESLKGLQTEAARRKVAHLDEQGRWERVHASRHVRFGSEADGASTMSVRTTVDAMAEIKAAIAHHQSQVFDHARRDGLRDPFEAYAADGLLAMARASLAPSGATTRLPTKVIVRVDHRALTRGRAVDGEHCELTGVGSVPVRQVAALLASGEAFTAVVGTDERGQVTTVAHLGRRRVVDVASLPGALTTRGHDVTTPQLRRGPDVYQCTALDWTTPTCTVAGCDLPRQQIDHRDDWARTRHTLLDELDGYCWFHHDQKTRLGPQIEPGVGRRSLVLPMATGGSEP